MNVICITGTLIGEPKIVSGKSRFLVCKIAVREMGFGSQAGRVFKKVFKAIVFGKNIDGLVAQLYNGCPVRAIGRAESEAYKAQNGDPKSVVQVVGQLEVELFSDDAPPTHAATPAESSPSSYASEPAPGEPDPDGSAHF
jgi:single-stranded DNA-binding protein